MDEIEEKILEFKIKSEGVGYNTALEEILEWIKDEEKKKIKASDIAKKILSMSENSRNKT